ncbi:hypothetical protein ABZP36_019602 [Zizania latifolia]
MAAPDEDGAGAGDQGGGERRRAVTAVLLLAAVALPCLVLYRAAVAPVSLFVRPAALPWQGAAAPPPPLDDVDSAVVSTSFLYVRLAFL